MSGRLSYDMVRSLLPAVEEARPVLDALLSTSRPDPDRMWSSAGELDTVGARLIDLGSLHAELESVIDRTHARLSALYRHVASALDRTAAGDQPGAARALLEAAAIEERSGRAASAAAFAEAAYRVVEGTPDRPEAGLALRRWARARRSLGRFGEALELYARATEQAEATGDSAGHAEATIGRGNVLEQTGRWEDAEAWYHRALEILEATKPLSAAHWHAPLNMHVVLRSRGAVQESKPWLEQAQAVAKRLNDRDSVAFLENARGQLLMAEDETREAERAFQAALAEASSPFASVTIRLNLAESLLRLERVLDAAEQARAAERDAIMGDAATKLPEVYRILGRLAHAAGNPDAFVLFERSLDLTGDDDGRRLERAMTLQAYAAAEARDPRTARDLLRQAHAAYRELGIRRDRRPWADCFDGASTDVSDSSSEIEDDHA